jgi:hypothetical protein
VGLKQNRVLSVILGNGGKISIVVTKIRTSSSTIGLVNPSLPFTLAPGKGARLQVRFKPSVKGTFNGKLTVLSDASDPILNLVVRGLGVTGSLTSTSPRVSFGRVRVGSGKAQYETLKNSSSTGVTVSAASVSESDFSLSGLSFPLTLRVGERYTFKTVFRPKSPGRKAGSLTVVSDAANSTLKIALSGEGAAAGKLSLSPASFNFGNVTVGKRKSLAGSLSASVAKVTVSSATLDSTEFLLSGLSLPLTLAPGQTAKFTVEFAPPMSGTASGKISFHSNAAEALVSDVLTGSGRVASQHSVTLNWGRSATKVAGYNVYRSPVSGRQYTKLNSVLDRNTTFTDGTVESGRTYYYVTTAVSADGTESTPSNQVEAAIP